MPRDPRWNLRERLEKIRRGGVTKESRSRSVVTISEMKEEEDSILRIVGGRSMLDNPYIGEGGGMVTTTSRSAERLGRGGEGVLHHKEN